MSIFGRFILLSLFSSALSAYQLPKGDLELQLGSSWGWSGKTQHINIEGLIGNDYTITKHSTNNGLVGVAYFLHGPQYKLFDLDYGLNFFYLPKTGVYGNVVQESLFTNLSYSYSLTNYPLYFVAKSIIKPSGKNYNFLLDVGIGPNFMNAHSFNETPINPNSLPDPAFGSKTNTVFAATIGAGFKLNEVFGQMPLEVGYRFFYLGGSSFKNISQQLNTFKTGPSYANAVVFTMHWDNPKPVITK